MILLFPIGILDELAEAVKMFFTFLGKGMNWVIVLILVLLIFSMKLSIRNQTPSDHK